MQRGFFLPADIGQLVKGECPTGQRAKPFKTASRAEPAPPEGWAWAKPIGLQGSSLAPRRAG